LSRKILAAILVLGLVGVTGYLYADTAATEAINAVAGSIECLDSADAPDGSAWIFTFRFTNPSRHDVTFHYYVEMYLGHDYITTLEYSVTVPAQRRAIVEARGPIGDAAYRTLLNNPDATYRYEGAFGARCLFIEKSWENTWSGH